MFPDLEFIKTCLNGLRSRIEKVEKSISQALASVKAQFADIIQDIIPIPQTASVGQVLAVKAVDENGKPTEWEVVDPMVVSSSTSGSTKKFKLTVDDSGTISATEVVS